MGIQHGAIELNIIGVDPMDSKKVTLGEINKALEWKLLFQFDSDDNLEFSWGDWGRVYFFIHEDDLKNRNFDNVKIAVDCY